MPVDKNGNEIKVGSLVRVVKIDLSILKTLPADEANDVRSMLDNILEVYEIDENQWGQYR